MPDGRPFEEQFLGFFPFSFFPAPDFENGDGIGAEELKRQWTEGENDFLITCFFHADIHELALELRNWCQNPQGEFPFRFHAGGMPDPVTRSRLTVRLLRRRDRIWHLDRPIIFEFRPVNRREAYEMESKYWMSVGDERRAQLAQEICERHTSTGSLTPGAATPSTTGQSPDQAKAPDEAASPGIRVDGPAVVGASEGGKAPGARDPRCGEGTGVSAVSFGQHMRALRGEAGLTCAEAARRAGIPASTLRNWENDRGFPSQPALLRLAEVLGVPIERFAEGVEDSAEDEPEPAQ
jgi:putative transcriptional regulator